MDAHTLPLSRAQRIEHRLREALSPEVIEVIDDSARHAGHSGAAAAGETHYNVFVVSAAFNDVNRVQRSRIVHDLLAAEFEGGLHALALSLRTPAESARLPV